MDAHKPDALIDSALQRDVESLLTVEPSADFLARVRARVANEPAPTFWPLRWRPLRRKGGSFDRPFRWVFAAAAAVAVVIVAGTAIWRSLDSARTIDGAAPAPLVAETSTSPAGVNPTEVVAQPPRSIEPVRRGPDLRRARRIAAVPEGRNLVAVVAPEDVKAFERLLASIRQPDVVLILTEDTTGPAALEAASIEITPIDIDTVPAGSQLEGGVE